MTDEHLQPVEYVLGFAFDPIGQYVLLINKNRPKWQEGLLNGVGGKVDAEDKSLEDAMVREFKEETGINTTKADWKYVGEHAISGKFSLSLFCTRLTDDQISELQQPTDEKPVWIDIQTIGELYFTGVQGLPMYLSCAEYHLFLPDSTVHIGNLI